MKRTAIILAMLFVIPFAMLAEDNDLKKLLNKLIDKKGFKTMIDIDGEGSVRILTRKSENDKPTDYLIITEDEDDAVVIWASTD